VFFLALHNNISVSRFRNGLTEVSQNDKEGDGRANDCVLPLRGKNVFNAGLATQ
jgi:hypothetical protein